MQHNVCVERQVIAALYRDLGTDDGLKTTLTRSEKDYASYDFDPSKYSDSNSLKRDYFVSNLLRKWKGLDTRIDLAAVTLDSWKEAEHQCFKTNVRLEHEASTGFYSVAPSVISDAQRKIASVLGRFNFKRIETGCRFGKGATSNLRYGSDIADKMLKEPTITKDCIPYFCVTLTDDTPFQEAVGGFSRLEVVDSNRMVMVPKNSKIHRMISAEPTMNGFVQQSVGRYIRRRLKKFGVDLDDQTINQVLAFQALADGLSTIDLSMASDTLCTNLVKLLLPEDWFSALDAMRSRKSTFLGKTYVLSKFSSMGNSFTFELESLIFWALTSATVNNEDRKIAVYGDDIVVHNEDYARVCSTLTWAGFKLNATKSYTFPSRFYESCGKHYFDLEDVTPTYQKDVCTRPHDFIRFYNRLVRGGIRLGLLMEFTECLAIIEREYKRKFPNEPFVRGPMIESDRYFIDASFKWPHGKDRIRVLCLDYLTTLRPGDERKEHMSYAYKLRRFEQLNLDPRGSYKVARSRRHKFHFVHIWRSALVEILGPSLPALDHVTLLYGERDVV